MLPDIRDYERLRAAFRWRVPERYNIGVDCCDRWAAVDPGKVAILEVQPDWSVVPVSYGELRAQSNRLANALRKRGVGEGDRVAILLPQGRLVPIAHMAAYRAERGSLLPLEMNACLPACVWNATPRSLSPLERNTGFWPQA